jgi:hypothetical protein
MCICEELGTRKLLKLTFIQTVTHLRLQDMRDHVERKASHQPVGTVAAV